MPDPQRQTLSASQMAGLWNASNYCSRWLLYQHFKNGMDIDDPGNERTDWGRRLQSVILAAASEEMRLEITENTEEQYIRHPDLPIGCTRDAHVIDPSRGFGIIEAKNVDWLVWRDTWLDGMAPKHIEIQLQTQMMVPDPEHGLPQWGAIVALVGGNQLEILPRDPNSDLQETIAAEAKQFFTDVAAGNEPDPFGLEREIPVLNALYPETDDYRVLDLSSNERADEIDSWLTLYAEAQAQRKAAEKRERQIKPKILALAGDAGRLEVLSHAAKIKKAEVPASFAKLPEEWRESIEAAVQSELLHPEHAMELQQILDAPGIQTRKPSVRNAITIEELAPTEDSIDPPSMADYVDAYDKAFGGEK